MSPVEGIDFKRLKTPEGSGQLGMKWAVPTEHRELKYTLECQKGFLCDCPPTQLSRLAQEQQSRAGMATEGAPTPLCAAARPRVTPGTICPMQGTRGHASPGVASTELWCRENAGSVPGVKGTAGPWGGGGGGGRCVAKQNQLHSPSAWCHQTL